MLLKMSKFNNDLIYNKSIFEQIRDNDSLKAKSFDHRASYQAIGYIIRKPSKTYYQSLINRHIPCHISI